MNPAHNLRLLLGGRGGEVSGPKGGSWLPGRDGSMIELRCMQILAASVRCVYGVYRQRYSGLERNLVTR